MQIAEFETLLPSFKLQTGFTMSQEQMLLLPMPDRGHDRTRLAVSFAGIVDAGGDGHTVNLALTYLAGQPHLFMSCGSPYLEGLETGVRFKRAKAAVASLCVPSTACFESDIQVQRRLADHWSVLARIERMEPRLDSLIAQNFETYPPSAYCAHAAHGFSNKSPCEHIAHALARLRLSGQNFVSHMQERFIAIHEYYTGKTPEDRPPFVDGVFVINRH